MFKQKKQIIVIIITAVIFFILGCFASGGTTRGIIGENTFQAGWDAAEQRLAESGFAPMMGMEGMEIKSLNGEIQGINSNKITLKIQPLSPLTDKELDTRIIEVANAKIYQLIERDQEEFQKEMEEFDKQMREQMENPEMMAESTSESFTPPEMFIKQEINLSDLQVGQQIMVEAGEDIKEVKQFAAVEIVVQFMPVIPQMTEEMLDGSLEM